MHRFLAGFMVAPLALYGWMFWSERFSDYRTVGDWLIVAISVVAAPLLAATVATAFLHVRKPRRWMTRGARGTKRAFVLGVMAGGFAMAASPFAIYFANRPWPGTEDAEWEPDLDVERVPDAVVPAAVSFPPALFAVWFMPRRRPGHCIRCGYDIRYSLDSGRCPECSERLGGGVKARNRCSDVAMHDLDGDSKKLVESGEVSLPSERSG